MVEGQDKLLAGVTKAQDKRLTKLEETCNRLNKFVAGIRNLTRDVNSDRRVLLDEADFVVLLEIAEEYFGNIQVEDSDDSLLVEELAQNFRAKSDT